MAQNIDGTANGTGIFNTKIPSYSESADIQAALRLFLYGSTTFDPAAEGARNNIPNPSIAKYLQVMQDEIATLQELGIGVTYGSEPSNPIAGEIWMPDTPQVTAVLPQAVIYQTTEPTTNVVNGMLWIDSNSSPLKMYVYDLDSTSWKEVGA